MFLHASASDSTDITPLAGLTLLWKLDLHSNRILNLLPLEGLSNLLLLEVYDNFLDLTPGAPSPQFIEELRAAGGFVTDLPQRRIELTIMRQAGSLRLSWAGFRGWRYEVYSTTSPESWSAVPIQSVSGVDTEMDLVLEPSGPGTYFRLRMTEAP